MQFGFAALASKLLMLPNVLEVSKNHVIIPLKKI